MEHVDVNNIIEQDVDVELPDEITKDVPMRDFELEQLRRELRTTHGLLDEAMTQKYAAEKAARYLREKLEELRNDIAILPRAELLEKLDRLLRS